MKHIKKIILGAVVFIIVVILGLAYAFVGNKNKIISVKVGENVFRAEVAETMAQKAKGLSFRDSLDKDSAMYFDFGKEGNQVFWMMGMRFPIDIIWIKNNVVVGIEKNVPAPEKGTPENALKRYYSPEPVDPVRSRPAEGSATATSGRPASNGVDKVLEINAGLSDELGIKVGDNFTIID
ncbi:MAG: DUF192 domain-containing protein [bacterium]|nr:DUF192 domain-containing protein [bacterium]